MTALALLLSTAVAATWWTEDADQADALGEVLAELWAGAHTVRVGEGGEGFVLDPDRLVWVGETEVREAPVGSLREAVVLARSWSSEGPAVPSTTWVPELPPAPRKERSWVLEDLDWGRHPGRIYAGIALAADGRAWGRVELASTTWVRARASASLGDRIAREQVYVPGEDEPMPGPRALAVALAGGLGLDLARGGLLLAPGLGIDSLHLLGAEGRQTELALAAELGHVREVDALVATLRAPPWVFAGAEGALEATGPRVELAYRRRSAIGWCVEGGLEARGPDAATRLGASLAAGIRVDLGGV